MAATNSVFCNDTAITLDWADVSGANLYHLQVSLKPNFASTIVNDTALAVSTKSFADSGANNAKRYWRWRYSTDGGTTWSRWSEVGSYWLDTGGAGDVTLSQGKWSMFDPDSVTDIFTFDDYPMYAITPSRINRIKARNRQGDLLSEYLTTKAIIEMEFDDSHFMTHRQKREGDRFDAEIRTFFLAVYRSNGIDYVPNVWKVEFSEDPATSMLAAGREDYFTGSWKFEEA